MFAVSLIGTAGMIFYKVISLRSHREVVTPTQSLEHYVGSFFKRIIQNLLYWIKTTWKAHILPFLLNILRFVFINVVRLNRKIRTYIIEFIVTRKKNGATPKGTTSFFLKDISEIKKNLKNGNDTN